MMIIVTGGPNSIGGNFTHYPLKEHPQDRVEPIDELTYDENLSKLILVMKKDSICIVNLGICDREGTMNLFDEKRHHLNCYYDGCLLKVWRGLITSGEYR